MAEESTTVETRLRKIERERRLMWMLVGGAMWALMVIILLLVVVAVERRGRQDGTIDAKQILLRDDEGHLRARFQVGSKEEVSLGLFNRAGALRVLVMVDPTGTPMIALADEAGHHRLALALDKLQSPNLLLTDKDANTRTKLNIDEDGSAHMSLFDVSGNERLDLAVAKTGNPYLFLSDSKAVPRAWLSLLGDGSPNMTFIRPGGEMASRFVFTDANGKELAWFGLSSLGLPGLLLNDSLGKTRAAIGVGRDGKAVVGTLDANGKAE